MQGGLEEMAGEEEENLSDTAYKLMHAKAEEEESARWATIEGRVYGGQRGHHGAARGRGQGRGHGQPTTPKTPQDQ